MKNIRAEPNIMESPSDNGSSINHAPTLRYVLRPWICSEFTPVAQAYLDGFQTSATMVSHLRKLLLQYSALFEDGSRVVMHFVLTMLSCFRNYKLRLP